MRIIWTRGKAKAKRFTLGGLYRNTEALEKKKEQHYCVGLGTFYSGQLPLEIVDIEGRERAKKALSL